MKVKHNKEHNKNNSKRQVHITKLFQKICGGWEQEKYQYTYLIKGGFFFRKSVKLTNPYPN